MTDELERLRQENQRLRGQLRSCRDNNGKLRDELRSRDLATPGDTRAARASVEELREHNQVLSRYAAHLERQLEQAINPFGYIEWARETLETDAISITFAAYDGDKPIVQTMVHTGQFDNPHNAIKGMMAATTGLPFKASPEDIKRHMPPIPMLHVLEVTDNLMPLYLHWKMLGDKEPYRQRRLALFNDCWEQYKREMIPTRRQRLQDWYGMCDESCESILGRMAWHASRLLETPKPHE